METDGYQVDPVSLRITSPGKFEGQPRYMPRMVKVYLDGFGHDVSREIDGYGITEIALSAADYTDYPELAGQTHITFYEDDRGFIYEVH